MHAQIFGGDHSITQWMTVPSLEKLTGGIIMQAGKHRDSHIKQVGPLLGLTPQKPFLHQCMHAWHPLSVHIIWGYSVACHKGACWWLCLRQGTHIRRCSCIPAAAGPGLSVPGQLCIPQCHCFNSYVGCPCVHAQRRQQGAAFTPEAMDAYLPRVVAICEDYLAQWAAQERVSLIPAVRARSRGFCRTLECFPSSCAWTMCMRACLE
jgi:hypothetical protein